MKGKECSQTRLSPSLDSMFKTSSEWAAFLKVTDVSDWLIPILMPCFFFLLALLIASLFTSKEVLDQLKKTLFLS